MTWRDLYTVVEFSNGDFNVFMECLKFLAEREATEEEKKKKDEMKIADSKFNAPG